MRSLQVRRWELVLLAIVLLLLTASAQAAITPESDVLLPWFVIDLEQHETGLSTTFTVVNASPKTVRARFTVYTNWGIPLLEVPVAFNRAEAKTIDLHAWIADGLLPNRTLTPAELANLHAALTGKPSPEDGLYYGTAFQPGIAVGYVIVQTLDDRADALWGDTYSVDIANNFFEAETLTALTHGLKADCNHHGVRFVNEGRLYEGDELVIWTGRRFEPSPTTTPIGPKMKIDIAIYDQAGHHVQDCHRELIAVDSIEICHLDITPPIGWLDITTEDPSFILKHLHSISQASAELHSYCLREDMKLEGPGITLEKKVNENEADQPLGPKYDVGDELEFEYYVTNSGTVALTAVTVTDDQGLDVTCPKATLAAGETMVCRATAPAEGCMNVNVGTAAGTAPNGVRVTAADPAYYIGKYHPALTLELLVNDQEADDPSGPYVEAGSTLQWTFVVTNSGDAPLTGVAVALKKGESAACPKSELAPGESMTCTAQSLAGEGQKHEVATAEGRDPCYLAAVTTDPAYYFGRKRAPAITIEKYVNESDADLPPGPVLDVGATIQWRFVVTNTGNMPLTGITVTDDQGITPQCPRTSLEPGESMTCTASSFALPCQQANTATASGVTTGETPLAVTATDAAHYGGVGHPAVTLELAINGDPADVPPGAWYDVNATLLLTYEVTNSGDVALTGIVVGDDHDHTAVCPKTALQPGESMTCTASMLAVAGTQELTGSVLGRPPCGEPVQAQDPAHYRGRALAASIDLVKTTNGVHADTAPGPSVAIGSTVTWAYLVTNTGTVSLTGVSVTDSGGVSVTCPKTALEPGESMTCTASGTAQPCQYTNTGTAVGESAGGGAVSASDVSFYFGQHQAAITLDKKTNGEDAAQPPGPSVTTGSTVQWTFVVTNTGDVPLTSVTVTDDRAAALTCPKTALAPGESMTCTASGTALAGPQRNVAVATGAPPCGANVTATDSSHYRGVTPAISLEKLINGQDADDAAHAVPLAVESPVLWSFVVTNSGDVTLSDISVTDNVVSGITCPATTLAPGASMTCTASGSAGPGLDCDTGHAAGTSPQGTVVESTDTACYFGSTVVADQGCTPGYWKNHTDSWPAAGYSPSQSVGSVFAQASFYPALQASTLLQSLGFGGGAGVTGAAEILLRAATAALLNASHPSVGYPRTPEAVIADVNAALATQDRDAMLVLAAALDADNNLGCPLN